MRLSPINRALAFCAALLLPAVLACSLLKPSPHTPAQEAHECFVKALEPSFGDLTEDIMRAILAGGSVGAIFRIHNIPEDQAMRAIVAIQACLMPVAAPQPAPFQDM